jgi:hypothetical protein
MSQSERANVHTLLGYLTEVEATDEQKQRLRSLVENLPSRPFEKGSTFSSRGELCLKVRSERVE